MSYKIRRVEDRRTINDFLAVPYTVYRNDTYWVPPYTPEVRRTLDNRKNPYFADTARELFVCYKYKQAVARATVVINPRYHFSNSGRLALFGYFECIDDAEAAGHLFNAVESYCKERSIDVLEGPFNPHHYSELGFKTDSFDSPSVYFQPYNPPYYNRLFEDFGYFISKILHTRKNDSVGDYMRSRYRTEMFTAGTNGFTVRTLRMNDLSNELERIREVFNDAFSGNWRFLSVSSEEYKFAAKLLRYVTFPELVVIVEDNGVPVGVLQCVLDVNPLLRRLNGTMGPVKYIKYLRAMRRIGTLIIYAAGIKKAYRGTGVFLCLVSSMCRMAMNFRRLETTWTTDDNLAVIGASRHLGLIPDKHFAIYRKEFL